jgi:hypothetical protein
MLKVLAALICITLVAAVFVVPKYGRVFKAYTAARSEYKAADAGYEAAEQKNADLTQKLEEMQGMKTETEELGQVEWKEKEDNRCYPTVFNLTGSPGLLRGASGPNR